MKDSMLAAFEYVFWKLKCLAFPNMFLSDPKELTFASLYILYILQDIRDR